MACGSKVVAGRRRSSGRISTANAPLLERVLDCGTMKTKLQQKHNFGYRKTTTDTSHPRSLPGVAAYAAPYAPAGRVASQHRAPPSGMAPWPAAIASKEAALRILPFVGDASNANPAKLMDYHAQTAACIRIRSHGKRRVGCIMCRLIGHIGSSYISDSASWIRRPACN